jgi:hypothetical protein
MLILPKLDIIKNKGQSGDPADKSNYTVPGRMHAGEGIRCAVGGGSVEPPLSKNLRITVDGKAWLAEEYK